jgi:hypothetical protein
VPKKNEVTGDWKNLRNKKFNCLQSSPNILGVIKTGRMRW